MSRLSPFASWTPEVQAAIQAALFRTVLPTAQLKCHILSLSSIHRERRMSTPAWKQPAQLPSQLRFRGSKPSSAPKLRAGCHATHKTTGPRMNGERDDLVFSSCSREFLKRAELGKERVELFQRRMAPSALLLQRIPRALRVPSVGRLFIHEWVDSKDKP